MPEVVVPATAAGSAGDWLAGIVYLVILVWLVCGTVHEYWLDRSRRQRDRQH
jgi:hypothetical protein